MLTLPDYQTVSLIYESANSVVYRGLRKKDNKPVILKMLKQDYPTPAELTRYRQEYEITYDLNLVGVIKVYDIEKYQNTLVIILEDLGGESLKQLMANQILALKAFLPMAIQIADNLGHIHATDIIHKDINPSNIVVNIETNQLKIIDFGIASRLPRENPTLKNPEQLEGTLAYLSPEQTGRINRSIDYRTDLYSLGVTCYEMLAGQLPFTATDAMELVHCHIAKTPASLCDVNPDVPPIVSDIVMKLLAKNAEDRYQSAFGVKADLEKCLENRPGFKNLAGLSFELAQNDFSGKLQIPQKLYGREHEIDTLLQAFKRVSEGATEMMLVAGYSGVGKTALVHEVHKPMTEKHGYFASGKFDQFQKNIPYSAITQAFNEFCRYLLLESAETLANWQSKILDAVGNNGQIIIDVIPDLELVIGKQPAVAKVGSTEAQNRFQMFFLNFVKALCDKDHPFILFIDDLQWVDSASLGLLKSILLDDEMRHLLIIGALRDNEVDSTHPFMMAASELQKANVIINTIELANLLFNDINHLLQDSLKCEVVRTQSLTDLIYQKTQGNAFFTHQFLQTLYFEALLRFDFKQHQWQWDVEQIAAQNITDNVVDLMIGQLKKLPLVTQQALRLAACMGNRFDLRSLSIIHEKSPVEVYQNLRLAIQEGLIIAASGLEATEDETQTAQFVIFNFQFLHDRVQQAAYALIDDHQKKAVHFSIGQLLLANTPTEERDDKIFEIIDHLNVGQELIIDSQEQLELAQLNLSAGKKAKDANAYEAARKYLTIGRDCLSGLFWDKHYDLTLALHKEQAEVEYLNGHFERSETLIDLILEQAKTPVEKAETYNLLIVQYTLRAKYEEAVHAGRKALVLLNVALPETDLETAFHVELAETKKHLVGKQIASLVDEPEMTLIDKRVIAKLLANMGPVAYLSDQALWRIITVKAINLALEYGPVLGATYCYGSYGCMSAILGDYQAGYEFGLLGIKLCERFNNIAQKCTALTQFGIYLSVWVKPIQQIDNIFNEGYRAGLESGNLQWAGYTLPHKVFTAFYHGRNLQQLLAEIPNFLLFHHQTKNQWACDLTLAYQMGISNLGGLTVNQISFDNDEISEAHYLESCEKHQSLAGICYYFILKSQIFYLYGKPTEALQSTLTAKKQLGFIVGTLPVSEYNFYHSLILVALYPNASATEQPIYREQLATNQKQMKNWADNCPENFRHKYLLVEAELARIEGKELEATMALYNQAIASARENEFIQNESLANELAAKFWLEKGQDEFAKLYMTKAHYAYQQWGATAKVQDLEEKYPQLLTARTSKTSDSTLKSATLMTSGSTLTQTSKLLDLDSVAKAAQTLAGEIVLSKLLEKMMHTLIENAGSERGLLILDKEGQWVIEASGTFEVNEVTVLQSLSVENRLPSTIINYVVRTRESVVLANAMLDGIYTEDTYIRQHQLKSILCSPILHQGQLIGLLYLENNLIEGAFTPARLKIVDMLSSQAAISLENALLYRTLEQKVEQRTTQLATANQKITKANKEIIVLNELLQEENLRMGAELDVAKQLQQMVLPKEAELQQIEGLDIAGFMEPADEVGGDYYEVLNHDGHIKIGIGDVTGHGLESGVVMLMVQTTVRALLLAGIENPETFLNVVNRTVYHNAQRMETDKNLTLSLLDYQDGQLCVTGQHEDVLVVRQGGKIERIDTVDLGFMVGVIPNIAKFVSHLDIQLQKGDGIVLYTDGITEARDPEMELYEIERLCEVVSRNWHKTAKEIQQAVVADVKKYIDTQKVFDDITLLVLKQK